MNRTYLRLAAILTGSAAVVMTTGVFTATNADPATYQVVASGLNNPRHLSFAPNGDLFVAEAGSGGSGTCINGSDGGVDCFGWTGSITEVTRSGQQFRVLRGLGSLATQTDDPTTPTSEVGTEAIGPAAVSVGRDGKYVITMGLGAPTALRATLPRRAGFATVMAGTLGHGHGHWYRSWQRGPRVIADLGAHEAATNPVDNIDTDPSSLLQLGSRSIVADAGANTVVAASHGRVHTLAAFQDTLVEFPPGSGTQIPMQAVPTSVAVGPHHALYVSQLTGFPFPVGASNIYQLSRWHAPTVYASGLTNVTDLAFARDGSLYAVEIASAGLQNGPIGSLVKIPAGGGPAVTIAGGLFAPYGVALHHGSAYVTTGSVAPGAGEVIRIPLS